MKTKKSPAAGNGSGTDSGRQEQHISSAVAMQGRAERDRTTAKLSRTTLTTSRLLDFASRKELIAQTGHQPDVWPLVALKELVDNALDAAEEAGTPPRITVEVNDTTITVRDNGPGIPPETIEGVVDFSKRVSSREAYVAPDRGAQGNALQTIVAMPFVLDGGCGRVEVAARGIRHLIEMRVDRIRQEPVVNPKRQPDEIVKSGTSVTVHWPHSASSILKDAAERFLQFAEDFCWLNPHLTLEVNWFGEQMRFEATAPDWVKWRPSDPTCPHWYGDEHFERLVCGYIAHDAEHGRDRTVRELICEFRGLSSSAKQKAVLECAGLARTGVSELRAGDGLDIKRVRRLRAALKEHSKAVKPASLGLIGKGHLRRRFEAVGCEMETFQYRKILDVTNGVPWVVETAFAWRPQADSRRLITGLNWSPGIINPFRELGRLGRSLDTVLTEQHAGEDEPVVLLLHMACPRVEYTDRGKSAVVIGGDVMNVADAITEAVRNVSRKWTKQRKAEERQESRKLRRREALTRRVRLTVKDAAWEVMPEAYAKASSGGTLPAHARQIMYAARGPIQEMTRRQLSDAYFTQTLLPDYINGNPEETADWDVVFDARGHFEEPHTEHNVPLGTLDVRQYLRRVESREDDGLKVIGDAGFPSRGPGDRYGAVLLIEKEGFLPLFRKVRLSETYDLAIMSTKGMSSVASRQLVDEICGRHGVPLLVLRDFDKAGFSIVGTLKRDTRRYEFSHDCTVIDLGLRLADVRKWKLEAEAVQYGERDPARNLRENGATEDEIKFLCNARSSSGSGYVGQRVELNAFTSGDLIWWIKGKLSEHGIRKVVPDEQTLEAAYRRSVRTRHIQQAISEAEEEADEIAASVSVPADLQRRIRERLDADRTRAWDDVVNELVDSSPGEERVS